MSTSLCWEIHLLVSPLADIFGCVFTPPLGSRTVLATKVSRRQSALNSFLNRIANLASGVMSLSVLDRSDRLMHRAYMTIGLLSGMVHFSGFARQSSTSGRSL